MEEIDRLVSTHMVHVLARGAGERKVYCTYVECEIDVHCEITRSAIGQTYDWHGADANHPWCTVPPILKVRRVIVELHDASGMNLMERIVPAKGDTSGWPPPKLGAAIVHSDQ